VDRASEGAWIWGHLQQWGREREPRSLPALIALLSIEDRWFPESEHVRRAAAQVLGLLGIAAVDELLAHPQGGILAREGAADALGFVTDAAALQRLHALALDRNPRVVLWASLSLAKHGESAVRILREALEDTADFHRAAHLADGLRLIGSPGAHRALSSYLAAAAPDVASNVHAVLEARG
jgi:hypothetical protein